MVSSDIRDDLARGLMESIVSFFRAARPEVRNPISEFEIEVGRSVVYVLYSSQGQPVMVGVLRAVESRKLAARRRADIEWLAARGYVASYRIVDFGNDQVAVGMARLLVELFGPALTLSGPTWQLGEWMENGDHAAELRPTQKAETADVQSPTVVPVTPTEESNGVATHVTPTEEPRETAIEVMKETVPVASVEEAPAPEADEPISTDVVPLVAEDAGDDDRATETEPSQPTPIVHRPLAQTAPSGLPLTKNQRREMRRQQQLKMLREGGDM